MNQDWLCCSHPRISYMRWHLLGHEFTEWRQWVAHRQSKYKTVSGSYFPPKDLRHLYFFTLCDGSRQPRKRCTLRTLRLSAGNGLINETWSLFSRLLSKHYGKGRTILGNCINIFLPHKSLCNKHWSKRLNAINLKLFVSPISSIWKLFSDLLD